MRTHSIATMAVKTKLLASADVHPSMIAMYLQYPSDTHKLYRMLLMKRCIDMSCARNVDEQNHSFASLSGQYIVDTRIHCCCPVVEHCSLYKVNLHGCMSFMKFSKYHVCQVITQALPR